MHVYASRAYESCAAKVLLTIRNDANQTFVHEPFTNFCGVRLVPALRSLDLACITRLRAPFLRDSLKQLGLTKEEKIIKEDTSSYKAMSSSSFTYMDEVRRQLGCLACLSDVA